MKALNITLIAVLLMGICPVCGDSVATSLAVSQSSPLYTHFTYMFAHAGFLHWAINGWALLVLHNVMYPYRLAASYTLAVIITFIPATTPSVSPEGLITTPAESSAGLLGASVITCFFFGFISPFIWKTDRLAACMMLALILIGFFIPGIAALPHLLMFLFGFAWYYIERTARSFITYCK